MRDLLLFFVSVSNTCQMLLQDILDVATYATNVATGESSVATYATCCDFPVAIFVAYVATYNISKSTLQRNHYLKVYVATDNCM